MRPSERTSSRSSTSSSVVIVDLALGEVVVLDALDDRPRRAVAAHRVAELQALGHAVLAVAARPRASGSRRPASAKCTLFTESIAAFAADAADDAPRFSITAAPRFCTVSMNSPCSHAVSVMTSGAGLAADAGVREVGELRGRVVAPDRDVA